MILIKYKDKTTTVIEPFLQCLKVEENKKTKYYINQHNINEKKYNAFIKAITEINHNFIMDLNYE